MSKEPKTTKKELKIKRLNKVTGVPFLEINPLEPVLIRFEGEITVGTMKKKTAFFARIVDLSTGEIKKLLVGAVLKRQLIENYGDNGFVGKSFEIIKGEKVKGAENEYFEYEITEIEVE